MNLTFYYYAQCCFEHSCMCLLVDVSTHLFGAYISGVVAGIKYTCVWQCHATFQSGCTILYSHQLCRRLPVVLCSHQHLVLLGFLILAKLMGKQLYLIGVPICVSVVTNDVEHLVMSIGYVVPSSVKCLTLLLIFNWVVRFFPINLQELFMYSVYDSCIKILYCIFSPSLWLTSLLF